MLVLVVSLSVCCFFFSFCYGLLFVCWMGCYVGKMIVGDVKVEMWLIGIVCDVVGLSSMEEVVVLILKVWCSEQCKDKVYEDCVVLLCYLL